MNRTSFKKRPMVLAILDGWGEAAPSSGNAIAMAETYWFDTWYKSYPHTLLEADGQKVGLLSGTTGNSEVGHVNIGAGYIVPQDEVRINKSIEDGSLASNEGLVATFQQARQQNGGLHLIGLVGPGEVHSRIDHLWALLDLAQKQSLDRVYVHLISDGRDAPPQWMGKNAVALQKKIESYGAKVVSLCGRYWAMDRNQQWDRTAKAAELLVKRRGRVAATLEGAVKQSYADQVTDEFIEPTVIANGQSIRDGDTLLIFNFRPDRMRQLTQALLRMPEAGPAAQKCPEHLWICTMTEYQKGLPVQAVAFAPSYVAHPLAEVVSKAGLRQLHISESEKYAHVTFFINGGREEPFAGEDRILVESPAVATYDLQPEMSSAKLTSQVIEAIDGSQYDLIILNFPNADMVGHSGNLEATIKAVKAVDSCLGDIWQALQKKNGVMFVTADHGNAEAMISPGYQPNTQHHPSRVPLLVLGDDLPGRLESGSLANVAPTLLQVMGLQPPAEMTARSLWYE